MTKRNRLGLVEVLLAWLCSLPIAAAAEPDADPALPPLPGLELWLDAAREAALREAANGAAPDGGQPLPRWHDASGHGRGAVQVDPERQPQLISVASDSDHDSAAGWTVRFDGRDDHLRALGVDRRFRSMTLFVVAAPHSNPGGYRGFFAFNERGRRDYQTGFNLDMNSPFSARFDNLNVEGRGFGGARDLRAEAVPFGTPEIIETIVDAENDQVRVAIDGGPSMQRECAGAELVADDITIGARHFENSSDAQRVQGFLHGDIAEVLLYDRVLEQPELEAVRGYLEQKHAALKTALPIALQRADAAKNVVPLVPVDDPPLVQMLVPGFEVQELPLELTNINNLRYRPDGKLYALGYSGDIWLLSDTDDDQLEDHAALFFEGQGRLRGPIGMAVIPPDHALLNQTAAGEQQASGVVVASKGKVSAILDADGDGVAEIERVIASGWEEIPQNVDAIGVAIDPRDGAIFFGLGTAAFNNAYLLDDAGVSHFDLSSERGTIQRIAPDLSGRSTVCTGVRFTVGMTFNADGELIVTDQEGATWLPHGNPFDELLHIQPGRHYGFPPRHPRYLPEVFDEPSLFDYAPQHQSTCGLAINEPLQPEGAIFGPDHWRGDALVTGESRGKLYRTRLVRDSAGEYVAENHLIACLSMLTVDCCLSPRGDLLVACHSGGPDWGTGPTGIGKLFRIRYAAPQAAQPVSVWTAGPQEVRVAFDRPLDLQQLDNLAERTEIEFGDYVAAGDRFESIRPGYAVTQMQMTAPRFRLPVYAASVTSDHRTLILATAPHQNVTGYALTLPDLNAPPQAENAAGGSVVSQHPGVDLAYGLTGVQAEWESAEEGIQGWQGWLPHPDLAVSRQLLAENAEYDGLWELLRRPGTLTLATRVETAGLFLPAVQPGSQLGFDPGDDNFIRRRWLKFTSSHAFEISASDGEFAAAKSSGPEGWSADAVLAPDQDSAALALRIETGGSLPHIRSAWAVSLAGGESREGPLALRRFLLPWSSKDSAFDAEPVKQPIPELAGGSWGRGRQVFFSDEAGCAKCHTASEDGHQIGPDLGNLVHRDYDSVLRDIRHPSFAINPDYVTYTALLDDGRVLTGAVHDDGDQLFIGDKEGKLTRLDRASVQQLRPAAISVMPEGIDKVLGPQRMKDLLTYLLREPPRMPNDSPLPAPPARTRSEVDAVLAGSDPRFDNANAPSPDLNPVRILLVAGPKDHGPGEHDYPAWLEVWSELLAAAPGVSVDTAMEWPDPEQLEVADTVVFFQKGSWNAERAAAIDAHLLRGGGLVYIHWAVEAGPEAPDFARRIGLASHAAHIKFRHGPLELHFNADAKHPIARNFDAVQLYDESYWLLRGDASRIRQIATAVEEGEPRPLFWTLEPQGGRVFVSIPGHYSWTFDDPLFRVLLLRGIAWSADEPVDRFNPLVLLGVPLAD